MTLIGLTAIVATGWFSTALISGRQASGDPMAAANHQMSASGPGTMTKEQKIADAMSAAPDSIAGKATILDWPAKEGAAPTVTPANHWVHHPPHVMIAVPDPKSLAGISTDPNNG